MNLQDLGFETAEIPVREGKTLTVRGISFNDTTKLVRIHGPSLAAMFVNLTKKEEGEGVALNDVEALVALAMAECPEVVADIIVLATDSPNANEAHKIATRLPLGVQVAAVEAIGRLTFESAGGPKKFVESVVNMLGGLNKLIADLSASTSGSQESAAKQAS